MLTWHTLNDIWMDGRASFFFFKVFSSFVYPPIHRLPYNYCYYIFYFHYTQIYDFNVCFRRGQKVNANLNYRLSQTIYVHSII